MRSKVPHERYDQDVMGMPVFAATEKLSIVISADDMKHAIAADDEHCALALSAKRQLASPYVSIGRARSDIAMPHPKGVRKPGYGDTLWAVVRHRNSPKAKEIIVEVDTGNAKMAGQMAVFNPQKQSLLPEVKRERNKRFRTNKATPGYETSGRRKGVKDALTELGVRSLTGQRVRD